MTREEVKSKLKEYNSGNTVYNNGIRSANRVAKIWINKVFDDFESRTCESCYFFNYDRYQGIALCYNHENRQEYINDANMQVTSDFSCNKWEKK